MWVVKSGFGGLVLGLFKVLECPVDRGGLWEFFWCYLIERWFLFSEELVFLVEIALQGGVDGYFARS